MPYNVMRILGIACVLLTIAHAGPPIYSIPRPVGEGWNAYAHVLCDQEPLLCCGARLPLVRGYEGAKVVNNGAPLDKHYKTFVSKYVITTDAQNASHPSLVLWNPFILTRTKSFQREIVKAAMVRLY